MTDQIKLEYDDPTIFAKCSGACTQHRNGKKVGNYFAKAYTERKWKRNPTCDNCNAPMQYLYELEKE